MSEITSLTRLEWVSTDPYNRQTDYLLRGVFTTADNKQERTFCMTSDYHHYHKKDLTPFIEQLQKLISQEEDPPSYHEKYKDPLIGGLLVGTMGAMSYILNEKGFPVTEGFHSFYLKNGTLMGETGSEVEVVKYHKGDRHI